MIHWLTPYAGIWAMTEPSARLMTWKVAALAERSLTAEQFAELQADAQPSGEDFVTVNDGIAVLTMKGVLSKEQLLSGPPSLETYTATIQRLTADESLHTLILKIDSPGGSVAGLDAAASAVRAARDRLRTIAYIDDCACSAAYWIASQASEVYANPTASVGSIGAYVVLIDSSAAAERSGYEVVVVGSGELKGLGQKGTKLDEDHRAEIQQQVDALGGLFVEAVADGRGLSVEAVQELHTGQVWIGQQAVELGLADRIVRFDELLLELQTENQLREDDSMNDIQTEEADEQGMVQRVTQGILQALGISGNANLLQDVQRRAERLRQQEAESDVERLLRSLDSRLTPAAQKPLREVMLQLHESDAGALVQLMNALELLPDHQLLVGELADEEKTGEPRLPSALSADERAYLQGRGVDEARDQQLRKSFGATYGAMD